MAAFSSPSITSSKRFFSESELEAMYPSAEWASMYPRIGVIAPATERVKTCTLQFLIALGLPIDSDHIEHFGAKLYTPDAKYYDLTPLMLAIMQGNESLARMLLGQSKKDNHYKEQLNAQDRYGWTIFHHAAFSCEALYQTFRGECSNPKNVETSTTGAYPWDVRLLTNLEHPVRIKEQAVFLNKGTETPLSAMTSTQLKQHLNLEIYRPAIYFPANEIQNLWKMEITPEMHMFGAFIDSFRNLMDQAGPKLILRESAALKGKMPFPLELIAGEDIPAGKAITAYTGEYCKIDQSHKSFSECMQDTSTRSANKFHPIYPERIGNAARFANCGFPNMRLGAAVANGISQTLYISSGIKKGEPLVWNYGGVPELQLGKMHLFRRKEMREFFQGGFSVIDTGFARHNNLLESGDINKILEANALLRRLTFPLIYTSAMLDLHYSGVLDIKDYHNALTSPSNPTHMLKHVLQPLMPFGPVYHLLFCECVISMDDKLRLNPIGAHIVRQWVLDQIGNLSVMQFVKIFKEVESVVNNPAMNDAAAWKDFLVKQEQKYADYDWSADPDAPISIKQKLARIIRSIAEFGDVRSAVNYMKNDVSSLPKDHENYQVYATVAKHFGFKP